MVKILITILLTIILFFAVKWLAFLIIKNVELPAYIDYKPYNCSSCLSFWLNLFTSVTITLLITKLSIVYIIITLLDGIAMLLDKRKFINL